MAFKFENLQVWKDAVDLSADISDHTTTFPKNEQYVLVPQMKRAADSIALNIAEGCMGQSNPEYRRFLNYSTRSGLELVCCLFLALRRRILHQQDFEDYRERLTILVKRLQALRKSLR